MRPEIKYALILGIIAMIWMPVEYLLGLHSQHFAIYLYTKNLFFLVPIFCIYKTMAEKKKLSGGTLSYEKAFLSGLFMSAMVIPFTVTGQYLYYTVINPGFFSIMIDHAVLAAHQAGENPLQALADAQEKYTFTRLMIESFLGPLFGGITFSAIIGLFIRTKKNSQ